MKNVKVVAAILFYLSRAFAIIYLSTTVYVLLVLLLENGGHTSWFDTSEPGRFVIMYPFTQTPFLLGDDTAEYLVSMVFLLAGYGVFAWLISNVFKIYLQPKLFTAAAVRTLSIFYLFNFIAPLLVILGVAILKGELRDVIIISILHGIIGIF
ncbi:MAG: hypothetical protein Q7T76_16250, partial [Ferruginibacter sp.]|nr:hypothetical protein [Ferruginibacter sp.]